MERNPEVTMWFGCADKEFRGHWGTSRGAQVGFCVETRITNVLCNESLRPSAIEVATTKASDNAVRHSMPGDTFVVGLFVSSAGTSVASDCTRSTSSSQVLL